MQLATLASQQKELHENEQQQKLLSSSQPNNINNISHPQAIIRPSSKPVISRAIPQSTKTLQQQQFIEQSNVSVPEMVTNSQINYKKFCKKCIIYTKPSLQNKLLKLKKFLPVIDIIITSHSSE